MQQQSPFSIQLRKYLKMIINIWPSLRPGLRHITDITTPHDQSLLSAKPYNTMTTQQFLQTLINDLHLFIMQHDVKDEDIQDYFFDILDLLNIDEEVTASNSQIGGIRYMSRQVTRVIHELQEGKTESVQKFEQKIYNPVMQMGVGEAIRQGEESSQQEGDMDEEDIQQQQNQGDWEQDQQEMKGEADEDIKKQEQQNKIDQQLKRQKQEKKLEDDGWVVVKKKK